ncbi:MULTISPECIES: HAMP domain-containing histidine kinase [unclassified Lactobacillus]|uniref:HAMP domain-containing sensor histidine kinase n=1 Tax=unclassified Lactobacillus TaxID=2620435 RepID=UPI000EFC73DB|nr:MULTISPECIES: HAMP domain-containing histidine kinase [unclassified Lactobacillus]RMC39133.1 sensor histidine kinase [Lactobacillus sp. ESL0237]RMC43416.1 sensor histidine kinase [Lactobacillus sp. ESL0234]RMC44328.1 sensor histidine kinase [Lactobacillus sp. ESL0236]RMC46765.1 sensor histidine kinase [Lactobacillus sp. ESL0230]RMC49428.1 sensor histidine kinase [Lactobacillus sp. ESL0225]
MRTMKKNNQKNIKETKHSSLIVHWVSVVALTIMVSFIVFSVIIYSIVDQQSMTQQRETSEEMMIKLNENLTRIPHELQISNVVPSLTPSIRNILQGNPAISDNDHSTNAFNDDLLSSLTNPDLNVVVYNLEKEDVFDNGSNIPKFKNFQGDYLMEKVYQNHHRQLVTYQKVRSIQTGKITGYIVVANKMTYYNGLMQKLLKWMVRISVIAIILFIIISLIIVLGIVKPVKEMSKVAREVNDDPNSTVRIKDFHRHDELQELAVSFNQMLDRMQRYIDQQKEFVGDVSHELRTPVAVIEGHLNMLERWGKDDPEILAESINASLQEAKRMQHLIQEMLDLTRAEQINVQYPNAVSRVADVLRRVTGNMAMVHTDFTISLDMDDLPLETEIQIYQGHLEQLLVVLIDNGIKYSTDRKELNISAGLDQNEVHIIVQDYGEGISKSEQSKIFNRFYRVDKARTREKGGNGLGLSIAQKLVTSYHGTISVESVEGQGSQFIMIFPVLSKAQAQKLRQREQSKQKNK